MDYIIELKDLSILRFVEEARRQVGSMSLQYFALAHITKIRPRFADNIAIPHCEEQHKRKTWAVALLAPLVDSYARMPRIQCDWHWSENAATALKRVLIINTTVFVNSLNKTKENFFDSIVAASARAKHNLV